MHIILDREGTVSSLENALRAVMAAPEVRSLFVLACDENRYPAPALDALLRSLRMPVFGGVFPAILHGREKLNTGSVVVGLTQEVAPQVIHGLSDPAADFLSRLERTMDAAHQGRTMLVLVDGLASRLASFIESLFCLWGLEVQYIGGGAGSLSFLQQPCLITNAGLMADAAVVVSLDTPSGVAVGSGWSPLSELRRESCLAAQCPGPCQRPFKATEVALSTILSLDWEPALQVYSDLVRCHESAQLSAGEVLALAKAYPLGILRLDQEHLVRDPLYHTADSHLVCVGEIPPGAFLNVLHGTETSLLQAAATARRQAREAAPTTTPALCLVMDCITRALFLGPAFSKELEALHSPDIPLVGACSIGEIANSGRRNLDFYNKTCAVAFLEQA